MLTALMVIDVQNDVVRDALNTDSVVSNINYLIEKARSAKVPVIWVQHSDDYLVKGSDGWNFVPELKPDPKDFHVYKTEPSSFSETDLETYVREAGITSLVITGAQTDYCINATSNDAADKGFKVVLVSDAHTTVDTPDLTAREIIDAKNESFRQKGEVLLTAEVSF